MMMVSLRDPLRDQLGFKDFAWGILVGALILPISSQLDYRRLLGGWGGRLALLAAFGLSLALISPLGKGPGTSDAKVNLFGTQPAEAIKILVVMFLAGYLADNWEFLRELNQKPTGVFAWFRRVKIPRLMYFLPVVIAMGIALVLFFKQKDLGPALVLALTFLSLYAIARNGAWLVAGGLAILAGGGVFAYQMMWPQTVYQRLRIAFSPWENGLRGGDQIAHSLWAFSTGEVTGTGLGLGDASIIPAGHTDLIISSLAEELGFAGVLMVVALYALLIARGIRAALRAENEYSFFFALGLTLITAWQILLISCGILGLFPLSGVVSPFLSYGSSSMLANFFIFGAILAISTQQRVQTHEQPFRQPVKWLAVVLGALAVIVIGRAAAVQLFSADDTLIKGVLTKQGDGFYRYSYNPRVIRARRLLPMGTIYDRNQLPLATSKWDELKKEENASRYSALGINVDETCSQSEARHYPFGGRMYYLIGGARTRDEVGAAQFGVEREYENVLRGFDDRAVLVKRTVTVPDPKTKELKTEQIETVLYDYRDLIPLVRHRYFLQHPRVRQLLEKKRDLQLAIDAALQLRVSDFVKAKVTEAHKQTGQSEKGSAVVMNPQNGNLLAVVSYPWPDDAPAGFKRPANAKDRKNQDSPDDEVASKIKVKKMVHDRCFIDRARGGRDAPGSTFKLVTAVAALSKDPGLHETTHHCASLKGESRVGVSMDYRGAKVIIRDDAKDSAHGNPAMSCGIQKSCNAYFAQLGVWDVGAKTLFETADKFGIKMARKNTAAELEKYLPQSAYGQGQIATDSFHLTLVSATIAAGGVMPGGRLVDDDNDQRTPKHERLLRADLASKIGEDMRRVIDHGTGQSLKSVSPSIAGKTGTAETGERTRSHSWFTGFAPYGGSQQIAFTVFIANSGYGGTYAAPVAKEIVEAAARLGLITQGSRTGVSNACSPSN
jgi:cell division protein FtsW (lipid II flippase)/cell division protein FtsI/penicillin-binding protein 2